VVLSLIQLLEVILNYFAKVEVNLHSRNPLQLGQLVLNFVEVRSCFFPINHVVFIKRFGVVNCHIVVEKNRWLVSVWYQIFRFDLESRVEVYLSLLVYLLQHFKIAQVAVKFAKNLHICIGLDILEGFIELHLSLLELSLLGQNHSIVVSHH